MWTYNNYTYPDEFYHHGVLGMKWGKRKTQPSSIRSSVLAGTYAATGSKRVGKALDKSNAKDAKRWEKAKSKETTKTTKTKIKKDKRGDYKNMSNEELKSKVSRLQLEKQYTTLTNTDVNKGKAIVNKIIKTGTNVAAVSTTALTLYNNVGKIKNILNEVKS